MKFFHRKKQSYNDVIQEMVATKAAIDELDQIAINLKPMQMQQDEARNDAGSSHCTSPTSPREEATPIISRTSLKQDETSKMTFGGDSLQFPLSDFERELEQAHSTSDKTSLAYSLDTNQFEKQEQPEKYCEESSPEEMDQLLPLEEKHEPPSLMDRLYSCFVRDMLSNGKKCSTAFEAVVDITIGQLDSKDKTREMDRTLSEAVDDINRQFDSDYDELKRKAEINPTNATSIFTAALEDIRSHLSIYRR